MEKNSAPDFDGYKKITEEDAELLLPLRVVYVDWGPDWCLSAPLETRDWTYEDGFIRSLQEFGRPYQFYMKVEEEDDG